MPDPIFALPRLARIYDALDPDRSDLEAYVAIADEVGATSILDIGCGTGELALLLAARGVEVVGVDPAAASVAVASAKPGAQSVRWVVGEVGDLSPLQVDLVTMTANAAQVFLDDAAWTATLEAARDALRPGGSLVFEVRDPAFEGWSEWNRERSHRVVDVDGEGPVESWVELTAVALPLVSFRHTYVFHADGTTLHSDSTLRFRSRDEVEASLVGAGFELVDVRDAPDRPGRELVFLARRPGAAR